MARPAPNPSRPMRLTVLTVVAVVLAFLVQALAPVKPPLTSDDLSGAIDHIYSTTAPTERAPVVPTAHNAAGR